MKHGDKAKAKSAKASSKPSVKKAIDKSSAGKTAKAGSQVSKGAKPPAGPAKKAVQPPPPPEKALPGKASVAARGAIRPTDANGFGNAVISAAFKRAVKKYGNAFRRLTD